MKKINLAFLALGFSFSLQAQIIDPEEVAKRKATDRANSRIDQGIDKGLDKVEEGIGSIFKKKDKQKTKSEKDVTKNVPDTEESPGKESEAPIDANNEVNDRTNDKKSDFVPGNKVLYFDNFQRVDIGDFPADFNTNASGEIVNRGEKPEKWLSMTKNGFFIPENIKELPENFTLEFEAGLIGDPGNNYSGLALNFTADKEQMTKDALFGEGSSILYLHPGADLASIQILPGNGGTEINNDIPMPQWSQKGKRFTKISIWRQKGRLRLYVNESKLVDAPRFFTESKPYHFAFSRRFFDECELLVTNIRYAVAGEDTRSKLITEGKFVTTGILFDVNSANIKPESGAVLREIATVLQDNPSVRVKIIGHTDSDGEANANLILSKNRALAVKNALENFYGIEGGRIETDGKGETQPVHANNTVEGKAQNRRVEFVRQ